MVPVDVAAISATEVRRVLEFLRQSRRLRDSPLLHLDWVSRRLHSEAQGDSLAQRERVLALCLNELTWQHLTRHRGLPTDERAWLPAAVERAHLVADFATDEPDRQAWSCLYHRYCAPRPMQVQELAAAIGVKGSDPARYVRRRMNRAFAIMAEAIRSAEWETRQAPALLPAAAPPPAHPAPQASEPAEPAVASPQTNIVVPRSSFVARAREVDVLGQRLLTGGLVTVVGPGGVGKTRLATELAARQLKTFPDGVWFVDLAALSQGEQVAAALAEQVVQGGPPGLSDLDAIARHIGERRLLVVMDNCEQIIDACAQVIETLTGMCPGLAVLATSREPLRLDAEQVWRLRPMEVPEPGLTLTADDLIDYPAVRLFVERAQDALPGFSLRRHAQDIVALCRHLDGLPLAIELAAARLRMMPIEEIAQRLDGRFQWLTRGRRTARPAHRTLRSTIDWSYDLLEPDAQVLFRRLAVFRGGWSLAGAEAVAGAPPLVTDRLVDHLGDLVDKSLVEVSLDGEAARYWMLESIRLYARQALAREGGGDARATETRFVDWAVAVAEAAEGDLQGAEQPAAVHVLTIEQDNLRAALDVAAVDPDPVPGLRLAGALAQYWLLKGQLSDGRFFLERALSGRCDPEAAAVRAKALEGLALLSRQQCDYPAARAAAGEALALRRDLGDHHGLAAGLRHLGNIADEEGDFTAAREHYQASLAEYRALGDDWGIAAVMNNLGLSAFHQGDFALARPALEDSLAAFRNLGEAWAEGVTLHNLGNLLFEVGDLDGAADLQRQSLAIAEQLDDQPGIAAALTSLGYIVGRQGDIDQAKGHYARAWPLLATVGDRQGVAEWLESVAELSQRGSDAWAATVLLGAAEALRADVGCPLPPKELEDRAALIGALRTALGEAGFAEATADGRDLGADGAAEWVLGRAGTVVG